MRKILSFILIIICIVSMLIGCNSNKEPIINNNTIPTAPIEQTKPTDEPTNGNEQTEPTTPDVTEPETTQPEATTPDIEVPEVTEPVETEPGLNLPAGFIYNLESFDVENLKEAEETTHLTHKTGNSSGTAHLRFNTEDFILKACENESNAVIFDAEGNPVAKICLEKNSYYNEEFLEEAATFELDRNRNWLHYLLTIDGEIYGHVAEYSHHSGYGSLHIACKNLDTLNQIISTLNKNSWSGGYWNVSVG